MTDSSKRNLLKTALIAPTVASAGMLLGASDNTRAGITHSNRLLKTSLNAYSFNMPLTDGSMKLEDMLAFCSDLGFDGVDITAYYFPGYPAVPSDDYLYHIKKTAFRLGLGISGTGVRNDFTEPDKQKRAESVKLVKSWIEAAEKMGAPVIRIFAGTQEPAGYARDQVIAWMIEDINACVDHGKKHGVVVALQNHYDYLKTADQVIDIIKAVNSDWFGLILDTGSFRMGDPYREIEKSIPYAVNWQAKEKIFIDGKEVDTDLTKLAKIIKESSYRGYLPIETLGMGDPKKKVSTLLRRFIEALV